MTKKWICSKCGKDAYYDGRCGDGPINMDPNRARRIPKYN